MAIRLFHLSDVHVTARRPADGPGDWLGKHGVAWTNWHMLRRGRKFAAAREVLEQFVGIVDAERPDLIVFSGDATGLGFAREARQAAEWLRVGAVPGFCIPGNHDHYTPSAVRKRGFEAAFAPWLAGERIDDHDYPFAREVDGVWFVGVNSAVPNRLFFDARGRIGSAQFARLETLMSRLPPGPRVLVTHYPFATAAGTPEPRYHGLRDRLELADFAKRHGFILWLCGHRHRSYRLGATAELPLEMLCAGSATMRGAAGFWDIVIDGATVAANRRDFEPPIHR